MEQKVDLKPLFSEEWSITQTLCYFLLLLESGESSNDDDEDEDEDEAENEAENDAEDEEEDEYEDEADDEDEDFKVEKLLGTRTYRRQVQYLVKWADGSEPSWEPTKNIHPGLIEIFENEREKEEKMDEN